MKYAVALGPVEGGRVQWDRGWPAEAGGALGANRWTERRRRLIWPLDTD